MEEFTYDLTKSKDVLQFIIVIFRLLKLGYAVIDLVQKHSLPWIASSKPPQPWSLESQVRRLELKPKVEAE